MRAKANTSRAACMGVCAWVSVRDWVCASSATRARGTVTQRHTYKMQQRGDRLIGRTIALVCVARLIPSLLAQAPPSEDRQHGCQGMGLLCEQARHL